MKHVEPAELARAVRAAHAGEALLDPGVAARLVAAIADPPGGARAPERLTPREREVLERLGARAAEQAHRARAGRSPRRP